MNRLGNAILTTGVTRGFVRVLFNEGTEMRGASRGEPLTKRDLDAALEIFALRMTVRLGTMLVVAIAAVATILKLA